jgi:hypothetical protein
MLLALVKATEVNGFVYNAPAEIWEAKELRLPLQGLSLPVLYIERWLTIGTGSDETSSGS